MKKIFIVCFLIFSFCLIGCKKEEELNNKNLTFTNQDVVIKSFYNDGEMVINLDIYDAKDTDEYCNGFYYSGNYEDFMRSLESNEYYYETLKGNVRFYCDQQFYVLQLIEQYGDCCLCKILSEYVTYEYITEETYCIIKIPFPRLGLDDSFVIIDNTIKLDAVYFDYFKKYYSNIQMFNIEISDNLIKIIDYEPINVFVKKCDISIVLEEYVYINVNVTEWSTPDDQN